MAPAAQGSQQSPDDLLGPFSSGAVIRAVGPAADLGALSPAEPEGGHPRRLIPHPPRKCSRGLGLPHQGFRTPLDGAGCYHHPQRAPPCTSKPCFLATQPWIAPSPTLGPHLPKYPSHLEPRAPVCACSVSGTPSSRLGSLGGLSLADPCHGAGSCRVEGSATGGRDHWRLVGPVYPKPKPGHPHPATRPEPGAWLPALLSHRHTSPTPVTFWRGSWAPGSTNRRSHPAAPAPPPRPHLLATSGLLAPW